MRQGNAKRQSSKRHTRSAKCGDENRSKPGTHEAELFLTVKLAVAAGARARPFPAISKVLATGGRLNVTNLRGHRSGGRGESFELCKVLNVETKTGVSSLDLSDHVHEGHKVGPGVRARADVGFKRDAEFSWIRACFIPDTRLNAGQSGTLKGH